MNQVQMNKLKVLITVGIIEVKTEKSQKLKNELSRLREALLNEDNLNAALYFGRVIQILKDEGIEDVDEYVNKIKEYIFWGASNSNKIKNILDVKVNEESPIEDLCLSVRTRKALKNQNIITVGQLMNYNENELYAMHGIGPCSLEDLKNRLWVHNLTLKN